MRDLNDRPDVDVDVDVEGDVGVDVAVGGESFLDFAKRTRGFVMLFFFVSTFFVPGGQGPQECNHILRNTQSSRATHCANL